MLFAVALAIGAAPACASPAAGAAPPGPRAGHAPLSLAGKRIGITAAGTDHYWDLQAYQGAVDEVKRLGGTPIALDAGRNDSRQIAQIQTLIAQQPDAIIEQLGTASVLEPWLRKIRQAGIPLFTIDTASPSSLNVVTSDNFAIGSQLALKLVNDIRGEGNVLVFNGFYGVPVCAIRYDQLKAVLKWYPKVKIIEPELRDVIPNTAQNAYAQISQLLQKYPKGAISAIWAAWDIPQVGATQAVDVRRVVKRFGGVAALRGASLAVTRGTVHGLIGQNGAGKSTLVKLLAGLHAPDEGEITVGGVPFASGGGGSRAPAGAARRHSTGIGFIHQERLLPATFTVAEALFFPHPPTLGGRASRLARLLPLDVKRMRRDCRAVLHTQFGLDLAPDRLIGELSVAEQQIVQITRALLGRHEILVFDEPSAALVSSEVDRLLRTIERLRANGHTILYVSHYLDEIARVCDRVSVLRDGADVAHFEARAVSRDTLVAAMIGAPQPAAAAPSAATARAAARADARVSARADAWGDDAHRAPAGADPARPGARAAPGAIALEARDLALPGRFGPLSLAVRRGEIVGLTGGLGSGGKDVIRALFGLARGVRGSIAVDGRPARVRRPHDAVAHGIALVPENRAAHGVALTLPVRENVVLADLSSVSRFGLVHGRREADVARALIRRLDIRPARPDLPARFLSGGNQQKVALAKWLGRASTVYLLDEPTVGVDVGAKAQIYRLIDALARAGAAVLLFSSDLTELLDVTDRVYVMARGEIVAQCASAETTTRDVLAWATRARDARPGGGAGAHDAAARTGTPGAAGAASSAAKVAT
ncbi:sugar ABC transporter [Burkholderia pseudomallei]|nr:ATP-binding cassette domain-containing protein [Burkholderia pseudomallei]AIS50129.1 ABC sugar (Ribose) transporter, periplasmic substrate-binding subunit domain protein [Burkholderia pseudomallei]EET02999.1 ABC transporter, carbohydrate uptake transporter-2 (CUT2) family, ATP-binding protein [Burkholderia pseudomallei 1710a]OMV79699.1 sugar ABC transporter [Burkholderia pseudomallei]OMV98331.1 sugar ABC transporter [Burkholderia pseudomallei]OMW01838.1 sugar ABC transporter [Burkholderia p